MKLFVSLMIVYGLLLMTSTAYAQSVLVLEEQLTTTCVHQSDAVITGTATVFVEQIPSELDVLQIGPDGVVSPISTANGNQMQPDSDGNRVVYSTNENGNYDIALYDLATGTTTLLTSDDANDEAAAISGDNIVFTTDRNGNRDIYVYNVTATRFQPLAATAADEKDPDIDGQLVAWSTLNSDDEVWATVLGGAPFKVGRGYKPSVSGDLIAYLSDRDVYVYDHRTGQASRITDDTYSRFEVKIDGRRVYWTDNRNGNYDVFVHDLDTGQTDQLTNDPSDQNLSDVKDGRVVYSDSRNGNADVFQLTYTRTAHRQH